MRQKQSKENSRRYHQKNEPAVKREAERLSTPTNTMEKNEKASLESRITSGMSMPYSVSEKESDRELEDRFERYREILKDLTLMSDSFMRAVLKNPKCTEEVLRIILNKDQLKVIDQRLQADYKIIRICRAGRQYWTVWPWTAITTFITWKFSKKGKAHLRSGPDITADYWI